MSMTESDKHLLDKRGSVLNKVELGKKQPTQKAVYDFSVLGGAVGDIKLGLIIPANAVVRNVTLDIVTAMASAGNAGTIALKLESAADLLAAVDADTLSDQTPGIPRQATESTHVKTSVERELTATVAVEALTAGKVVVILDVYLSE